MAENLTNKHIYETYHSLIKTGDNGPIDDTLKVLSDGDGNELPIEVSTDTTKFKEGSTADFTDVTIIGAEGFQGPQGPQGVAGTQGPQGTNGINGAQGPQGAQGINGVDGAQGAQGAQGINGVDGAQGAQGPQGTNGVDGAQGAQGTNGVDGAQGAQGPQGFQGSVGGVAINDVTPGTVHTGNMVETIIDTILVPANTVNSGDIFNYLARINGTKLVSNNTTIRAYINNIGAIGGQTLISTGFNIPGASTQATINRYFYVNQANGTGLGTQIWNASGITEITASPVNFIQVAIDWTVDQYIVLTGQLAASTNSVSCTGATFFNTAGAAGAQGPQGPGVGDQGPQGPQGPQGLTGPQGATGAQGVQGPQGFQGNNGISSGATYYFNQSQASDVLPYKVLTTEPSGTAQQTVTTNLTGSQQNVKVGDGFITSELGFAAIPGGTQRFHFHYLKQAVNDEIEAYATIQLADATGIPIGPIIQTGVSLVGWVDAATPVEVTLDLTLPTSGIDPTNRMIVNIYLNNNDSTAHSVIWYTEGTQYYAFVTTTVGVIGNQGPQGPQGFQGIAGINGAQGFQGPQGDQGANSTVPGPQGTQGPQGPSGGGGGGGTPAMTLMELPPSKGAFISNTDSWKTWVATSGFATVNQNIQNTQAGYGIFPMREGGTISAIQFNVGTAQPGSNMWCAIYRLGIDVNGQLILTDRLLDCGTVSSATTGVKQINLSPSFIMPAGETYGAVGIVIGGDTAGTQARAWSTPIWDGNGGRLISGDFYRINSRFITGAGITTSPINLANATYASDTNNAIYIVIK